MIDVIDRNKCTGCKMCRDVCDFGAISFIIDNEGFWYPKVDDQKCTKCGLCIKLCPAINGYKSNKIMPKVYAAWSKDRNIRINSTSGGIFYELSKEVIAKGGYIVGAQYTSDYKGAEHIWSNSLEGLKKIMGSKYFQSDTAGIFKNVKHLLDNDETVLFCGTPCHNAALSKYLIQEYPKLTQCDFICRGVNSPKVYRKFIEMLEKQYGAEVDFVHFKDKRKGWNRFGTFIAFKNGKTYFKDRYHCLFTRGYIEDNLYMRPSCHNCNYKTLPRVSDISLADFWGVRRVGKHLDQDLGTSVVMINSKKGMKLFDTISNNITFFEQTVNAVEIENKCLFESAQKGENRDSFFKNIDNMPFDKLVKNYTSRKYPQYYARVLRRNLSYILSIINKIICPNK